MRTRHPVIVVEHHLPPYDEIDHEDACAHPPWHCPDKEPEAIVHASRMVAVPLCTHQCVCGPKWWGGDPYHLHVTHHDVITVPGAGCLAGRGSYG